MTYPCETKINKQIIWFLLWDLMYSTKTWPRLRQRSHGNILKLPQNPGHGVMCSSCWRLAGSELTKHIHPTICWPWSLRLLILESWFRWHQILGNSPSEGIGELNVTFGAVVLDCLPLFFWGEGTAMFFFFAFVFHLALGKLEGWRVREQEGMFWLSLFSVLVFQEYYFISKFKWKSYERRDCFCLCLFWYPTSLLANCWACLFWSIEEDGPMEIEIPGFPWSKRTPPLRELKRTQAELKSFSTASSDVLEPTCCQAARALDLRSAMIFFVAKDNGFILDPDATRSLRTQVRDWQALVPTPKCGFERLFLSGWNFEGFGPRAACFILQARMLCSSSASPRAKSCIPSVSTHGMVIQMMCTIDMINGGDPDSE